MSERLELLIPWEGTAYRVTTLDYPRPKDILLGQGSFLYGGRWNAPGSFRAVYGSTSDVVAVAESRATADYAGIRLPFRTPRLVVAVAFDLKSVLDLTSSETLQAVGLLPSELTSEDWRKMQNGGLESLTQCCGRAAFEIGANAALVPSAKVPQGVNVVYFPENRLREEEAEVCAPEKLARIRGLEQ